MVLVRASWSVFAAVAGRFEAPASSLLVPSDDQGDVWEPFLGDAPFE